MHPFESTPRAVLRNVLIVLGVVLAPRMSVNKYDVVLAGVGLVVALLAASLVRCWRTMRAGALVDAWRFHARSLMERGGWRFVPFTRFLARASLRRREA
jgi:hypothetical protein